MNEDVKLGKKHMAPVPDLEDVMLRKIIDNLDRIASALEGINNKLETTENFYGREAGIGLADIIHDTECNATPCEGGTVCNMPRY